MANKDLQRAKAAKIQANLQIVNEILCKIMLKFTFKSNSRLKMKTKSSLQGLVNV